MCDPASIIAGGASIIGGVMSNRAANRQAQSVENADAQRRADTQTAINQYNQNSPAAAMSRQYSGSLTSQIAGMLGLTPSQPAYGMGAYGGAPQQYYGGDAFSRGMGGEGGGIGAGLDLMGRGNGQFTGGFGGGQQIMGGPMGGQGGPMSPTDTMRSLPGYQFQFNEGMNALQQSQAARNGMYSGKAMKEITRYGQDYAETKYQTHLSNMMNMMGTMDGASVNTLNAATGNAAQSFNAQVAAAGHRNDGSASMIGGLMGGAGALAGGLTQSLTPSVNPNKNQIKLGG